jgi:hypothetical protein
MEFIDPSIVPKKDNFWFLLYHTYTTSKKRDKKFEDAIDRDMDVARKLGVKHIIVEDYYDKLRVGDYLKTWNDDNFRYMINAAHRNGMKAHLYLDLLEVDTKSKVHKEHEKEWSAKDYFGLRFYGFSTVFLPHLFNENQQVRSKIFCLTKGRQDYILEQVNQLFENFGIDGIYIDRLDYRVKCRDKRHGSKNHFEDGISEALIRLSKLVHKRGGRFIVNDSCMKVIDKQLRDGIKHSDYVQTEVLPTELNLRGWLVLFYCHFFEKLVWKLRNHIKGLTKYIMIKKFYSAKNMTDPKWITYLVKRLKIAGAKKVTIFSQNCTETGFRAVCEVAKKTNSSVTFITGNDKLAEAVKHHVEGENEK